MRNLDQLRIGRHDIIPFASKLEFDRWTDEVLAALSDDQASRHRFKNLASGVETAYVFKMNPLDAINRATGFVDEVAMARASEAKRAGEPGDVPERDQLPKDAPGDGCNVTSPPRSAIRKLWEKFTVQIGVAITAAVTAAATAVVTKWL